MGRGVREREIEERSGELRNEGNAREGERGTVALAQGKGPLRLLMFTCVFFLEAVVSSLQRCGSRGDSCVFVCAHLCASLERQTSFPQSFKERDSSTQRSFTA